MPSTIGIVASGEDVLNDAVFWVDAGRSSIVTDALSNLGTGGSVLNARFGSTTSPDGFDPTYLTHTGTNYVYLSGVAGNSVSCTAPATAVSFAASPLGGGADTTGAVTGGAAFTFSTAGSWTTVRLLNAASATVAQFTVTAADMTSMTDAYAVTWTVNRSSAGKKTATVTRPILLFGTDDYLEVADNDLLDFGAGEPFTVAIVTRQWNTMTSQGAAIAKKTGNGTIGTGWLIRNGIGASSDGTALDTYDGTTATTRAAPTGKTSGALSVITGLASSTQLTAYFNNTASAATTRQAGSYANSEVMRIGRLSGVSTQYIDMELIAAAVWRRALNANEIATIVARYT